MKKFSGFIVPILFVQLFASVLLAEGKTSVGGHVKMTLYDSVSGSRSWGSKGVLGTSQEGAQNMGMSFKELIIYISHELSDNLVIEVQPKFDVSTGATPKFGSNIGKQVTAPGLVEPKFDGWEKATLKAYMPYNLELTAGMMLPVFTMEYGHELFWENMVNSHKFLSNINLGTWHDTGLELYAPLTIGESISFPLYLYLLNGNSGYADYNSSPVGMVHVEPQWGIITVSGSIALGKTDSGSNTFTRWSAGAIIKSGEIEVRAEYAGGKWEKAKTAGSPMAADYGQDALAEGYLAKILYRPAKWLQFMFHHEVATHNFGGFFYFAPGTGEKYITNTPGMQIYLTDTTILQMQVDIADWVKTNGSERLVFTRPTLGLRSTF